MVVEVVVELLDAALVVRIVAPVEPLDAALEERIAAAAVEQVSD